MSDPSYPAGTDTSVRVEDATFICPHDDCPAYNGAQGPRPEWTGQVGIHLGAVDAVENYNCPDCGREGELSYE